MSSVTVSPPASTEPSFASNGVDWSTPVKSTAVAEATCIVVFRVTTISPVATSGFMRYQTSAPESLPPLTATSSRSSVIASPLNVTPEAPTFPSTKVCSMTTRSLLEPAATVCDQVRLNTEVMSIAAVAVSDVLTIAIATKIPSNTQQHSRDLLLRYKYNQYN